MIEDEDAPGLEPADDEAVATRRRIPWTRALRISLLAFAVWLLLDAPTLQHNAQVSPVGVRRTVSLDVLGPIAAVSRGVGLSHVVSVADGIMGRNGNRPGHGSLHVTAGPPGGQRAGGSSGPHGPVDPAGGGAGASVLHPSAADPLPVLVVGDSLGLDLAGSLVNGLTGTGVVDATADAVESTGLTRPDYYDWPAELQSDLARVHPQVVVVMMGANDPQDFRGPPDVPYGSDQWDAEYGQRVRSFMQEAASGGARVVWVGMPPMADPGLSAEMAHVDAIDRAQAAAVPAVAYLGSGTLIGGPGGAYAAYVDDGGREVHVRSPDGIHVTPDGAEILSRGVMDVLRQRLHVVLPG